MDEWLHSSPLTDELKGNYLQCTLVLINTGEEISGKYLLIPLLFAAQVN